MSGPREGGSSMGRKIKSAPGSSGEKVTSAGKILCKQTPRVAKPPINGREFCLTPPRLPSKILKSLSSEGQSDAAINHIRDPRGHCESTDAVDSNNGKFLRANNEALLWASSASVLSDDLLVVAVKAPL